MKFYVKKSNIRINKVFLDFIRQIITRFILKSLIFFFISYLKMYANERVFNNDVSIDVYVEYIQFGGKITMNNLHEHIFI